jgi:hypothetical protein
MCARPCKLVTNLSQQKNLLHPRMKEIGERWFHCLFHQCELQFHSNNQCPPVAGKPETVKPPLVHLQFARLYTKGVMIIKESQHATTTISTQKCWIGHRFRY